MAEELDDGVVLLTYDEAAALLPDGDRIHTFLSTPIALVGADWDRADVLALLESTGRREVTGPQAQAMKHGLAAFRDGEPVFIEAREWKPAEADGEAERHFQAATGWDGDD